MDWGASASPRFSTVTTTEGPATQVRAVPFGNLIRKSDWGSSWKASWTVLMRSMPQPVAASVEKTMTTRNERALCKSHCCNPEAGRMSRPTFSIWSFLVLCIHLSDVGVMFYLCRYRKIYKPICIYSLYYEKVIPKQCRNGNFLLTIESRICIFALVRSTVRNGNETEL